MAEVSLSWRKPTPISSPFRMNANASGASVAATVPWATPRVIAPSAASRSSPTTFLTASAAVTAATVTEAVSSASGSTFAYRSSIASAAVRRRPSERSRWRCVPAVSGRRVFQSGTSASPAATL